MRLLRKVNRLAAAAAAAMDPLEGRPLGIVWTRDNQRLPETVEIAAHEHVARDVHVITLGGVAPQYRVVERVAEGDDWGGVFDWRGVRVGRVHACEADRAELLDIEWEVDPASVPDAPPDQGGPAVTPPGGGMNR